MVKYFLITRKAIINMEYKFHIDIKEGYEDMLMQYSEMRTQFSTIRNFKANQSDNEIIYDIDSNYGEGCIKVYKLMGNVTLTIFDVVFHQDIIIEFDLSQEYFEVEYCVDGCLCIKESKIGSMCLSPNDISVSMSRGTCGSVRYCAGQKYQGISITAEKVAIDSYFGSCGIELWEETIEQLENTLREQYYQGIKASPEIGNAFLQIFNCSLPKKSKNLFFESKVMEIFSKIISYEILGTDLTEQISLSEFEINQIKKVPEILMTNLYELPTVSTLSKQLAINRNKLAKGFKMIYGDTIFRYHRKMCLQRAATLLLDTDRSINEIALDVGYSNSSNFCYAFKREFGITPLQYRSTSL